MAGGSAQKRAETKTRKPKNSNNFTRRELSFKMTMLGKSPETMKKLRLICEDKLPGAHQEILDLSFMLKLN